MTDEDKKRAAHPDLVDRVLNGAGAASAQQRADAFNNEGLSPPLDALIGKVVDGPALVTGDGFSRREGCGLRRGPDF